MEHGIKRAGADSVTVPPKLLDHPLPVDAVFYRMVKDMKSDKAGQQLAMLGAFCGQDSQLLYRISMSGTDPK
jgi:hypothetical protein